MRFLVKIIIGIGVFGFLNNMAFAEANSGKSPCKDDSKVQTSVLIDKEKQKPYCFFTHEGSAFCEHGLCEDLGTTKANNISSSQLWIFDDSVGSKTGISLIQIYLSKILGYALQFGAMLAVLAIVVGGIQVSMSMEGESKGPGKEKIIGGIAALLVLFFAGVILNFINPAYYVW